MLPEPLTESVTRTRLRTKVAPRLTLRSMITVQRGAVPTQAPVQPVKVAPGAAAAARCTSLPSAYDAEQSRPHAIPRSALTTLPTGLGVTRSCLACSTAASPAAAPTRTASAARHRRPAEAPRIRPSSAVTTVSSTGRRSSKAQERRQRLALVLERAPVACIEPVERVQQDPAVGVAPGAGDLSVDEERVERVR